MQETNKFQTKPHTASKCYNPKIWWLETTRYSFIFFNCIYYYFIVGPCWLSILNIAVCCYRLVAKSCLTLCNHMDCRPPGSSVHGISQARILEWVAISSSRSSSKSRDQTSISCIGRWILSYTLISYVLWIHWSQLGRSHLNYLMQLLSVLP